MENATGGRRRLRCSKPYHPPPLEWKRNHDPHRLVWQRNNFEKTSKNGLDKLQKAITCYSSTDKPPPLRQSGKVGLKHVIGHLVDVCTDGKRKNSKMLIAHSNQFHLPTSPSRGGAQGELCEKKTRAYRSRGVIGTTADGRPGESCHISTSTSH